MPSELPDFGSCEDEPIRIPGSIQRHGFLLLVQEATGTVVAASDNTEEFLGIPLKFVLGAEVDSLLEREVLSSVHALTFSGQVSVDQITYLGAFPLRGQLYTVAAHHVDGRLVLEFERDDRLTSPELMNAVITNFVSKLSKLGDELELCQAITRQVHDLTDFDRVLLYSFDSAGNGTVLAEESNGHLPSYLGLRFPGSDIPRQARELYVLNTVRIIPDASYTPSPLRGLPAVAVTSLDLSLSLLRSVSPIHLEYMKNMGTQASMSISIVSEGKLWGLISCHHAKPRSVTYLVRSACDLLTKLVGTHLTGLRNNASLAKKLHFHSIQRSILTRMAAQDDHASALSSQMRSLTQVTDAAGTALVLDGGCQLSGTTPGEENVLRLVAWMDERPELELFSTAALSEHFSWAEDIKATASGVLAARISSHRQKYLIWFRPEVVQTVHWAGKPSSSFDRSATLNPRQSFKAWQELLRGQAEPWSEAALESARDFRTALLAIDLKRAQADVELSDARFQQLTQAIPNLVWATDNEGHLTYVNRNWLDQGLNHKGLWFEQPRFAPEERLLCAQRWTAAVDDGAMFELELRLQSELFSTERSFIVRATPYLTAGLRAGWIGTGTDLTESRERERTLQINEKLAITGRMSSVIAHEINNPLEAITNLLFLLRTDLPEAGSSRMYLSLAESELQRIAGITKQTLRWTRESTGTSEFGRVGDLFEDARRLFTAQLRNRGVTLSILHGGQLTVFGILSQLKQVMANLISNAIAAVPIGGSIRLSAAHTGDMLEIQVADNGPGMTQETLKRIGEPFYSTKGDLGNGLGLYICRETMEKHGGQMLIQSQVGLGTTVRILLPGASLLQD